MSLNGCCLAEEDGPREIVFTFDDLIYGGSDPGLERIIELNENILATLRKFSIQAVGFVNEDKLHREGEFDERCSILVKWIEAGQKLGNHTYSHPDYHRVSFEEFSEDVIRGETVTRRLLSEAGLQLTYFRHPYLHTGRSLEDKNKLEDFLRNRGYTIAPVTIDNMEFMFNAVYAAARKSGDTLAMEQTGESYITYIDRIIRFYEDAAEAMYGRQMKQILLLHANEINAEYLDELAGLLLSRGYRFISIEEALQDDAYAGVDRYTGPAGVSWLFRWDFSGNKTFDWQQEPPVPTDIEELYRKTREKY
jgi:peptidoglycan/xylan/chitin deacetylase (PgdA/CDA1 family)